MAEKDERFWIHYPLPKNAGEIEARRCTTMTRQEAIERISKAFVNLYIEIEGTGITYTAKEVAEAALNAIAPMIPQEEQNER